MDTIGKHDETSGGMISFLPGGKIVGHYYLDPLMRLGTTQRPSLWKRFWMRVILGWPWKSD